MSLMKKVTVGALAAVGVLTLLTSSGRARAWHRGYAPCLVHSPLIASAM
jgi:hypothetical protein